MINLLCLFAVSLQLVYIFIHIFFAAFFLSSTWLERVGKRVTWAQGTRLEWKLNMGKYVNFNVAFSIWGRVP